MHRGAADPGRDLISEACELWQDFVVKLLSGTAPTLDLHALWIIPDGQLERDESLCYEASLVNRSHPHL